MIDDHRGREIDVSSLVGKGLNLVWVSRMIDDEPKEYGFAIGFNNVSELTRAHIIAYLHMDAQRSLPSCSRYEIRGKLLGDDPHAGPPLYLDGIAWFHRTTMVNDLSWGEKQPEATQTHNLIGQYVTLDGGSTARIEPDPKRFLAQNKPMPESSWPLPPPWPFTEWGPNLSVSQIEKFMHASG